MEQQIARIALSGVPYSADKLYSYLVPPELADACRAGVRVSVPFGRGNRRTEGFVLETLCEAADKPLKPVFTVLDEQPLLDASLLRLAKWMKARYFCTVYDALKTILPAGIWFRYRETYRLADGVQESDLSALAAANRTDKLLLETITARGELERSELEELGGAQTMKRLKLLCEQGVLYSETMAIRQISDKSVRMVSLAVSAEDALAYLDSAPMPTVIKADGLALGSRNALRAGHALLVGYLLLYRRVAANAARAGKGGHRLLCQAGGPACQQARAR